MREYKQQQYERPIRIGTYPFQQRIKSAGKQQDVSGNKYLFGHHSFCRKQQRCQYKCG